MLLEGKGWSNEKTRPHEGEQSRRAASAPSVEYRQVLQMPSSLEPGARVGPYEVVAPLGKGGMGEVWRASDPRLHREVAIKVLPADVAGDRLRLARFEREAKLLASLNHPNVAALYGLETAGDTPCLVLELVEGEDLSQRLRRGPLGVDEAIGIARQIAEALAAAHEKAIVHRDLKPANVKVTPEGRVKVLDFGLAKALDEAPQGDLLEFDTPLAISVRMGGVLGTPAYMSPEQARGGPLDRRTDVWSFGCVLFEMLAGRRPFAGGTAAEAVAAILSAPPEWRALPAATPLRVRTLLQRCLQKDVQHRLRDLGDAQLELEDALSAPITDPLASPTAVSPTARWAAWLRTGGIGALAGGALTAAFTMAVARRAPEVPWFPKRFGVAVPAGVSFVHPALAFSPDGKRLVFEGLANGHSQLFSRALDALAAVPIPGTEGGRSPFFSPDGRWLGFESGEKLRKVPVPGGDVLTLCDAPGLRGAAWTADGTIVFAPYTWEGLWQVSAEGGPATRLTQLDPREHEASHRWPVVLPGGRAVLFSILPISVREEERRIAIVDRSTGAVRTLLRGGNHPVYSASGHLLYARQGTLFALPFDARRLRVSGQPIPVLEDVRTWPKGWGLASFDVSSAGVLAYVSGFLSPAANELVFVDRLGRTRRVSDERRAYHDPTVSPDGRGLAVSVEGENDDVWVLELAGGHWRRLTFEGDNRAPVWSPDGTRVAISSNRSGEWAVYWTAADGSGTAEPLGPGRNWVYPSSFTPDGRAIVVSDQTSRNGHDVLALSLSGHRFEPLVASPFDETAGCVSPDGRWLAFVSDESGRSEVYVRPYPGAGPKLQVSNGGGNSPRFSRDGRELFYRNGPAVLAVAVKTGAGLEAGSPRPLFEGRYESAAWYGSARDWDVTPDGRFVMVSASEESTVAQIVVVPDAFAELAHRVPAERWPARSVAGGCAAGEPAVRHSVTIPAAITTTCLVIICSNSSSE